MNEFIYCSEELNTRKLWFGHLSATSTENALRDTMTILCNVITVINSHKKTNSEEYNSDHQIAVTYV